MSRIQALTVKSLFTAMILGSIISQPALAQKTVQHRQSDLDFVSRMNQQAALMSTQVRELESRLGKGERSVDVERRTPERLRHKDRAISKTDEQRFGNELKQLRCQIQQEQNRLKSASFDDQKSVREQEQRMQKLDAKIRQLQTEIAIPST